MRLYRGVRRRVSSCPIRPVTPEVAGSSPVAPGHRPSRLTARNRHEFIVATSGGKVVEKRGGYRAQKLSLTTGAKRPNQAETIASGGHQSPPTSHGKQGVCRGLPPGAGGPLPVREEVGLLKNAKSCEPEGPQDLTTRL